MADPENAGYRLLSFEYKQPVKEAEPLGPVDITDTTPKSATTTPPPATKELPSLSSLMASLQEIDGSINHEQETKVKATAEEPTAASAVVEEGSDDSGVAPPAVSLLTEFHLFGDLPTELRLKIWDLTFLPRVVELRPTRPNYSPSHDDGRRPQWQSGCSNPAALSVCAEARAMALEHFRTAFPLACITSTPAQSPDPLNPYLRYSAGGDTGHYSFTGPSADGRARLLRRTLYVSPDEDTVCLLGQDSDFARLSHVMRLFQEADPKGLGIARLGLSVRGWGYGGSAVMMKGLGRTILRDLEQLVLFMYGEHKPPPEWRERGAALGGEQLEAFRRTGNCCELVPCEGSSAWLAYKVWSGGKGRQFWDDDGNILRVGRNEIRIMDLEFKDGW
ncbi:hypothetical protein M406DRAFT_354810 [Cryphonectria parasitica EP155]|uniref:2EXR domain-containing protein n=1 Tax=Cryphonectria parasitica (strain ATCC 38755 / EP155) TaxID=660469 RepID=A0A9P4YE86_CRYP1|nr:uncharacterized protein M406DRAFT_354810 [Cryphonectria parasitica EP155]KAF3771311.1 hypothetical protein M406DRAFT_354810 [Cryphonectria parasitica EP155]